MVFWFSKKVLFMGCRIICYNDISIEVDKMKSIVK